MKTVTEQTRVLPPTHRLFFDSGVALTELALHLPDIKELPDRITAYYSDLCDALIDFCESVLFPACKAEYAGNPDPRKRFTYRRAVLSMTCECTRTTDCFSVRRSLTLRQGITARTFLHGEVFRLSDGRLLPLFSWLRENRAFVVSLGSAEPRDGQSRLSLSRRYRRAEYYLSGKCPILLIRGEELPLTSVLSCKECKWKRKNLHLLANLPKINGFH